MVLGCPSIRTQRRTQGFSKKLRAIDFGIDSLRGEAARERRPGVLLTYASFSGSGSFPRDLLDQKFRAGRSEVPGRERGASGCAESAHESRTEEWETCRGGERVVRAQEQRSPCRTRRSQCLPQRALIRATYGRRSWSGAVRRSRRFGPLGL